MALQVPNGIHLNKEPDDKCPICHGTGWELYKTYDGSEEIYGKPTEIEYARRCRCKSNAFVSEDRTEFPLMYRDCDIYKFDWNSYKDDMASIKSVVLSFFNEFEKWADEPKGLYIWSKTPGSGKTFLSACLAKSVMLRTQKTIKYVTPMGYMEKVSEGYNNKDILDPSKVYRECTLLVLDDLGTQKTNDWNEQELFRLIDTRLSNNLPTIITSNYSIDKLNVDERLKSRILKSSISIHMPEESIRNKKADAEHKRFVSKILGKGGNNE